MGTDLKDRLAHAMERRDMSVAALVKATGLTKSAIHFLLNGTTRPQTVRAWNIDLLADALRVDRDWLLYGRGHMDREGGVKLASGQSGQPSHFAPLDPAILARAEFWARVEEKAGVEYPDLRRAERIIDLYRMVEADGGDLSAEHAIALVESARKGGKASDRSRTGSSGAA